MKQNIKITALLSFLIALSGCGAGRRTDSIIMKVSNEGIDRSYLYYREKALKDTYGEEILNYNYFLSMYSHDIDRNILGYDSVVNDAGYQEGLVSCSASLGYKPAVEYGIGLVRSRNSNANPIILCLEENEDRDDAWHYCRVPKLLAPCPSTIR